MQLRGEVIKSRISRVSQDLSRSPRKKRKAAKVSDHKPSLCLFHHLRITTQAPSLRLASSSEDSQVCLPICILLRLICAILLLTSSSHLNDIQCGISRQACNNRCISSNTSEASHPDLRSLLSGLDSQPSVLPSQWDLLAKKNNSLTTTTATLTSCSRRQCSTEVKTYTALNSYATSVGGQRRPQKMNKARRTKMMSRKSAPQSRTCRSCSHSNWTATTDLCRIDTTCIDVSVGRVSI